MSLQAALDALRAAKRISGTRASYQKDNPAEYLTVMSYLDGGPRPSGVDGFTLLGKGLCLVEDERRGVAPPPPPPPDELRWPRPALSNPVQVTLTNANRGALANGGGKDAFVRVGEVLAGVVPIGGWRNLVWMGGEFHRTGSPTTSGHIVPQNNSGTLHFEGIKARVSGDFFGARFTNPIIQIQNCDIQVSDEGSSAHADAFQTQYLTCDELRVDRCTIRTDYQGFFISNEPMISGQPLPSKLGKFTLSRTNFRPGPQGYPATFLFKAIPPRSGAQPLGPWVLEDVWIPDDNPTMRVYPSSSGRDWAGNPLATKCSRIGNTLVWTSDAGISGVLNIGTPADFAVGAGMNYA